MSRIIRQLYPEVIRKTAARCRERGIVIPTFRQLRDPVPYPCRQSHAGCPGVGLWDVNPLNLFRITWKNDIRTGLYGPVNYLEIPSAITA